MVVLEGTAFDTMLTPLTRLFLLQIIFMLKTPFFRHGGFLRVEKENPMRVLCIYK